MKTIVRKETNVSLYLFDDVEVVTMTDENTVIGDPPKMIIADCSTSNATLFEGVTNPDEWTGWKYLYTDADGWVLNPDWTAPEV